MGAPAFRASWSKSAINEIKRLGDADRQRVLQAISEPIREQVRAVTTVTWLPLQLFIDIARAVEEQLGTEQARQFWKRQFLRSLSSGTVRQMVQGAMTLFERNPYGFLRTSPVAFRLMARDCGVHEVTQPEPDVAHVIFRDSPREFCGSPFFALCYGLCLGVLEKVQTPGEIVEDVQDARDSHRFRYIVRYGRALR